MLARYAGDRDLLDPAEHSFRQDSVPAGGWITFIACGTGAVYVVAWAESHQAAMAVLLVVATVGGAIVLRLPWDRILRSPLREPAFIAWSLLDVALIIALAGLDGGGDS